MDQKAAVTPAFAPNSTSFPVEGKPEADPRGRGLGPSHEKSGFFWAEGLVKVEIPLRKGDFYAFLAEGLVNRDDHGINGLPRQFRVGDPAQEL